MRSITQRFKFFVKNRFLELLKLLFEIYASIIFMRGWQNGLIVFSLTFWVRSIGALGLMGASIGIIFCQLLQIIQDTKQSKSYILNCILIGMFEGMLFSFNFQAVILLILLCILTFFLFSVIYQFLNSRALPILSIPFSFSASFLLSLMPFLKRFELSYPYHWEEQWAFHSQWSILEQCFKSLSSIIFIPNTTLGVILFILILVYSRVQAIIISLILGCSYLLSSFLTGHSLTAESSYWSNFNFILFGLSTGGFLLLPSLSSLLLTLISFSFCFCVFQVFLFSWSLRVEWIHSLPYSVSCLIVLTTVRRYFPKLINPFLGQPAEKCLELMDSRVKRFGSGWITLHFPIAGNSRISQGFNGPWTHQGKWKYALDFIVHKDQKSHCDQGAKCENYFIFGSPVLSPCYGWIEQIEDQLSDREIGFVDHKNNWGNFVLIRTHNGLFVLLSHLKGHSISVKLGDYVHPGQKLGLVGNSGYSPEPHLHLHVQTELNLGSETVPFQMEPYSAGQKIYFHSIPKLDAEVSPLHENRNLQYALNFSIGQELWFQKHDKDQPLEKICLKVVLDLITGKHGFEDAGGSKVNFWKDEKYFYLYDLISERGSPLNDLMAACPIVPFTFGKKFKWREPLPMSVQPNKMKHTLTQLKSFLGIKDCPLYGLYQMDASGMKIQGRVICAEYKMRSAVEFHPQKGLFMFQLGTRVYRRIEST